MANGMTRETFDHASPETQRGYLFDMIKDISQELCRRKKYDTVKTIFGGFMGGFTVLAAKLLIWK